MTYQQGQGAPGWQVGAAPARVPAQPPVSGPVGWGAPASVPAATPSGWGAPGAAYGQVPSSWGAPAPAPAQPAWGPAPVGVAPAPAGWRPQAMPMPQTTPTYFPPASIAPLPRRSNLAVNIVAVLVGLLFVVVAVVMFAVLASKANLDKPAGSALVALIPITFVWMVVWFIDRWQRKPIGSLLLAVFWGAGPTVALVLLLHAIVDGILSLSGVTESQMEIIGACVEAPLFEESMKGLALLLLYVAARRHINGPLDGIVFGALSGAGFAFTENVLYFTNAWQMSSESGHGAAGLIGQFFIRGIAMPMLHPMCVSLTGAAVGFAARRGGAVRVILAGMLGLIPAMMLHATWNTVATMAQLSQTETEAMFTIIVGFFCLMVPTFIAWVSFIVVLRVGQARMTRDALAVYERAGWFSPVEVQALSTMHGRSGLRRAGRRRGRAAGRAMRDFITETSYLVMLRYQINRNRPTPSRRRDEADTLALIRALRYRAQPELASIS